VGFKLEIGDLIYSVEPHVRLGPSEGVAYPCEPDFLISLDRASEQPIRVAVFLDGYRYHKDIVHEDLMKRQGIFLSTDMLTWSLTWHDVNHVFAGSEVKVPNAYRENIDNPPPAISALADKHDLKDHSAAVDVSPLPMLMNFLANPDMERWKGYAMLRAFSWLDKNRMQSPDEKENLVNHAKKWPSQYTDKIDFEDLIFTSSNMADTPEYSTQTFISGGQKAITEFDPKAMILATIFDPKNTDTEPAQRAWQKLLQIANLGQFLPWFFAGTKKGIEEGHFGQLQWGVERASMEEAEWDRVVQLADEDAHDLINELAAKGLSLPEVGYELMDDRGASVAEAELVWEHSRIALLLEFQIEEGRQAFLDAGWKVFELKEKTTLISSLKGAE
jgi:DEAD/DEAH box helicase domain-containing protein